MGGRISGVQVVASEVIYEHSSTPRSEVSSALTFPGEVNSVPAQRIEEKKSFPGNYYRSSTMTTVQSSWNGPFPANERQASNNSISISKDVPGKCFRHRRIRPHSKIGRLAIICFRNPV